MKKMLFALALLVTACGGGGGGGGGTTPPPPPVMNVSPGGIWQGTDSSNGATVTGLVDESGDAYFIDSNGVQYVPRGALTISGNSVTGTFDGYSLSGQPFADGSQHGVGTLTGTIAERSSFTGNTSFTTDNGSTVTGVLTLTFNALYDNPSALSTIAGNYTDPVTGDVVSIDSDGTAFMQDPVTGCVLNGTFAIIDATYNAYRATATFSNCTGDLAVLNGATLTGLATLDSLTNPETLIVGISGTAGNDRAAFAFSFNRD